MESIEQVKTRLSHLNHAQLGFFPTPLHRLPNLSKELGVDLWCKRDDLTGMSLFGGNKVRKLEYVMGEAVALGCDTVVSYGASQSNCAMQVTTACRKLGLKPILYLADLVGTTEVRSNLMLDYILDAEVHLVPSDGRSEEETEDEAVRLGREHMARLQQEGHKCYEVPMGAAEPLGSAGFAGGWAEMMEQFDAERVEPQYLFHGTGTGGTLAGLAAGRKLLGRGPKIVAVNVSPKDESYLQKVSDLGTAALRAVGSDLTVTPADFTTDLGYYGAGYEIPSDSATAAIRRLARTEGLIVDPVYTGKALAGLIGHVESGKVPQGSTVVFWHTGGATTLFAEPEMVGNVTGNGK
ncbi:MAG: pyridoxal-phosphate dependent enzyme [Clostridia bacterium]|nr:pyridoxal-phosphate dependent enzyme [Clostridia bacterium]